MSEAIDVWLDGAVGETRYLLARQGRPITLTITRWSDAGRRARWGEVYGGRVRKVERALRGAFVDLGLKDEQGFLPLSQGRDVREGELIAVSIAREGTRAKGPVLALTDTTNPSAIGRIARREEDEAHDRAAPASADKRAAIDAAIDEALAQRVALAGGGAITIEPTTALTAIDVDSAGRTGEADPERLALALNVAAANEAMRQLRLRAQGGLAAIDFVSLRQAANRKAVEAALKAAAQGDPWGVVFAPMSRFGIVELSRAQLMRPVRDVLLDADGRKSAETVALAALRAIERETAASRGRKVVAALAQEVADWLGANHIGWRDALTARIGAHWEIESAPNAPREKMDVRAL
ncbi:MAG TPA: ribonuclease E/G [Caulobacterales bacterium]|nr:ribonuclease E/G [Caulobacterales bacterium]